ncbi:7384_t:CDS:2, partial [Cetraspora pellucida]
KLSDTNTEQFDEFLNEDDKFPKIACFISHFQIKNIIHSSVSVEYSSTLPEVSKEEQNCMGIKVSHFTDPLLINIEHNEVNVESPLWKKITENQDVDIRKTNTYIQEILDVFYAAKNNHQELKNYIQHIDEIVVEIKSDMDETSEIRIDDMSTSIELQERKMTLLEHQLKLRKEMAEVEALELQNQQLKINLETTRILAGNGLNLMISPIQRKL